MITLRLTEAQAERLATVLDGEIAAGKNRLVSATLSTTDYRDHAPALASTVAGDELIRANLRRQGVA